MKVRRGAIAVALFTVALAVTAAAVACTHDNGPPPSAEVTEPSPIPNLVRSRRLSISARSRRRRSERFSTTAAE